MASERQKVVEFASLVNNLLVLRTANIAVGVNQSGSLRGEFESVVRVRENPMNSLFGVELPAIVTAAIIALVLVPLLVGVIWLIVGRYRPYIRRIIIQISEVMALVVIVISSIAGGLSLILFVKIVWQFDPPTAVSIFAFILGALISFAVTGLALALLFLLIEIAENTKKTVAFFERVYSRAQQ